MCCEKERGGLGIRDLRTFNLALLGKWVWRSKLETIALSYRVLVARYGVNIAFRG